MPSSGAPYNAVDKPKFMGRPPLAPHNPWWKAGWPESFLGCPNYFDLSLKEICFLVINTKFACFLFNHVPTYWELGRPSGDFGGHVGSPNRVMGHICRLGDPLSTALLLEGEQGASRHAFSNFKKNHHCTDSICKLTIGLNVIHVYAFGGEFLFFSFSSSQMNSMFETCLRQI